jgi:DNA-binding NarL/FixJ family response regulator
VSSDPAEAPGSEALTAVIVDDTPDIRMLTRMALEMDSGVRVVAEAENGQEGIDVVRTHQPDVVILDMAMPVMDGLEALPHIREACPTARVLVVSGFDNATMSASAAEAGADGYLQKGAPPATLLDRVRQLAAGPRSKALSDHAPDHQQDLRPDSRPELHARPERQPAPRS